MASKIGTTLNSKVNVIHKKTSAGEKQLVVQNTVTGKLGGLLPGKTV